MSNKGAPGLLDTVFNHYLSMDPEVRQKLAAFDGKVIAIDVQGFNKILYLFPEHGRIRVDELYEGVADTILKGTPAKLFKLGFANNAAPMLLSGEIEISGDVRLGREFKKLLNEMDIDWEEQLAHVLGDATANQLMQLGRSFGGWARRATSSFADDISEYLQEETRDVLSGAELENFYHDVDELRNDADRLQARIEALKKET